MVLTIRFRSRVSSGLFNALRWLLETMAEVFVTGTVELAASAFIASAFWGARSQQRSSLERQNAR